MKSSLTSMPTRQFVLLLAGTALVVVAATASLITTPQLRRLAAARSAVTSMDQSKPSGDALATVIAQRDAQLVNLSKALQGGTDLPARQFESFVVEQLQNKAWQNSVELQSVVPRQGDMIDVFREQRFDLIVSGSYADIFAWVHTLKHDLGFVVIKEMQLSRANGSENNATDPNLLARLALASYKQVTP